MSQTTNEFVLPKSVVMTPKDMLSTELRARLPSDDSDVALTIQGSRRPSKLVSAALARLLSHFRTPTTLVAAILAYSKSESQDPDAVLLEAFAALQSLHNDEFLLLAAPQTKDAGVSSVTLPGGTIGAFRIEKSIQVLADSEVYQVTSPDGVLLALKLFRQPKRDSGHTPPEIQALHYLTGSVKPMVYASGEHSGYPYIVLEWIRGISADRVSHQFRASQRSRPDLLAMCQRIIAGFAEIHRQGVVHGDVHPGNILIEDTGSVRIIDFSLSRIISENGRLDNPMRGAIPYFMDPEMACAKASNRRPPHATFGSDQFSLGAVIYFLITGRHYCDFVVTREEMLWQIQHAPPRPMMELGDFAAKVEPVLFTALAKDPGARYRSLDDFLAHFESLKSHVERRETIIPDLAVTALRPFRDEVVAELSKAEYEAFLRTHSGPRASVAHGAAGIAYGLCRLAALTEDAVILSAADRWASWATRMSESDPRAFHDKALELSESSIPRTSIYYGSLGVPFVHTIVGGSLGNVALARHSLETFLGVLDPSGKHELMLGSSGQLLAIALLLENIPADLGIDTAPLRAAGARIEDATLGALDSDDLGAFISALNSFTGVAHGLAGVLYATLRWRRNVGTAPPSSIVQALDALASQARPAGRGLRWPRKWNGVESYASWCNGSAGMVHLWASAYELVGDPRYRELAVAAAWDTWDADEPGTDLCCGLVGRAYALLRCYQMTSSAELVDKAMALTHRAVERHSSLKHQLGGLWKGTLSLGLLVADLERPDSAVMPVF